MHSVKGYVSLLLLAVVVFSCSKEANKLGTSVVPANSRLQFGYDTAITINAYSMIDDSVRTDETSLNVLGSYWDPVFGITTASIYGQLRLPSTGHSFGTNPVIDSAVLVLSFSGAYGDSSAMQTIKLHEVTEQMYYDSIYYSNKSLQIDPIPLASKTFLASPYDSVLVDTVKVSPRMKIRIDQSAPAFIQKLLTASTTVMASNDEFIKYVYGLYLTAESPAGSNQGLLMYLNLESTISGLTLYYKNDETDSLSFDYVINSSSARYNNYNHFGYAQANPEFIQQVVQKDTILGKNTLYLQAMGGVKTVLKFPDLSNLTQDGKVAINEARLVIYDGEHNSTYKAPGSLILIRQKSDGDIAFLPDQYIGDTYFGGTYDSTLYNYNFRITRYIQSLVAGTELSSTSLFLLAPSAAVRGHRLVINGTAPSNQAVAQKKIQLQVLFTKLP